MKTSKKTVLLKSMFVVLMTTLLAACANLSAIKHAPVPVSAAAVVKPPMVMATPSYPAPRGSHLEYQLKPLWISAQFPPMGAIPWKPNNLVPVLFATNRNRTGTEIPYYFYGNDPVDETKDSQLRRGIAVIKVPPKREKGDLDRPDWIGVTLERVSDSPLARAFNVPKIRAENPETEFSYAQKIEELSQPQFQSALKNAVSQSKSKTAVLYVHGYANDFTDAAFRTAQIAFDLATPDYDLVPLMFSWPSDPGMTGRNYNKARNRQSRVSGYDLAHFLREISATTDIGTVHIIAHSMGAEVLGHAIEKLGVTGMGKAEPGKPVRPVFRHIVFAAPDVTPRIFKEIIEPAISTRHMVTTYGARTDLPLWLSYIKNGYPATGSVEAGTKCVDTVDVTAVTKKLSLSHSTWAESPRVLDDLRRVLRDGLRPSLRGLTRRDSVVWSLPAKAEGSLQAKPVQVPDFLGCSQYGDKP